MRWNWNRRIVHQVVATLIKNKRRDLLHDFLVMAMSMQTARQILGIESLRPTPDEVKRAWKRKALENHPDRGGDPEMMKMINVAHDVLMGKQRAKPDSGWGPQQRPRPQQEPRRPPPPPPPREPKPGAKKAKPGAKKAGPKAGPVRYSRWAEAKRQARIPPGTKFKFITAPVQDLARGAMGFVAYGTSDKAHVFVAILHEITPEHTDTYAMQKSVISLSKPLVAFGAKRIKDMLGTIGMSAPADLKVVALPEGTPFSREVMTPTGAYISLQDFVKQQGGGSEQAGPAADKAKGKSWNDAVADAKVRTDAIYRFRTAGGMNIKGDDITYGYVIYAYEYPESFVVSVLARTNRATQQTDFKFTSSTIRLRFQVPDAASVTKMIKQAWPKGVSPFRGSVMVLPTRRFGDWIHTWDGNKIPLERALKMTEGM